MSRHYGRQDKQPQVWDPPAATPYARSSDTSMAAAVDIEPHAGTMRAQVLDFIRARGDEGATDDEIEVALDMRHQTASARRNDLAGLKWVVDSGRTRLTRSGRKATVWVAKGE